jgi:fructokinase
MYDVVALGELLIDFTPLPHHPGTQIAYEQNPGGAPANVLVALSRFGHRTAFIGKVGDDQFGHYLRHVLESQSIDTQGLVMTSEVPTTLAFVHLNDRGERSFSFYRNPGADTTLTETEVDVRLIEQARVFHFGSLSMTHEPARSATLRALSDAKQNGLVVTYDPNLRKPLWRDLTEARQIILTGFRYADIVKISEEELEFLVDSSDLEFGSQTLCDNYGVKLLLMTLGARGCYYRLGEAFGVVPGFPVNTVDTTGAGDAFFGALIGTLLESSDMFGQLDEEKLKVALRVANAAGALTTTKRGAIPAIPTLRQVQQFLAERGLV